MAKGAAPNPTSSQSSAASPIASRATSLADLSAEQVLIKLGFLNRPREQNEHPIVQIMGALSKILTKVPTDTRLASVRTGLFSVVALLSDLGEVSPDTQVQVDALAHVQAQEKQLDERLGMVAKALADNSARAVSMEEKLEMIMNKVLMLESSVIRQSTGNAQTHRAGTVTATFGPSTSGLMSFAQVVVSAPIGHEDAVARVAMVNRQVVIQKSEADGVDTFKGLSEMQILAKAQLAVKMMAGEGTAEAEGVKFLHARKTARGGAILITQTVEAAAWLRREEVIDKFAEKLGGATQAKADLFMLIVEYVPTLFNPGVFAAFGQVE